MPNKRAFKEIRKEFKLRDMELEIKQETLPNSEKIKRARVILQEQARIALDPA